MNFPMRCGRLEPHKPHDWIGGGRWERWSRRVYHCTGHVIVAGAERVWDDEDDAAEDRMDREKRDR